MINSIKLIYYFNRAVFAFMKQDVFIYDMHEQNEKLTTHFNHLGSYFN